MAALVCKDGKTIGWNQLSISDSLSSESLTIRANVSYDPYEERRKRKGLSILSAAVFIVGEMAGSGILALPSSVAGTGWAGIGMIVFACFAAAYSGVHLAKCWTICEERWAEYRTCCRDPYSRIGLRAIGPKTQAFTSFNVIIQLFGVSVVMLLLCSELTHELLKDYVEFPVCKWIVVFGVILCPFMWFGSPQDFAPIAFVAMSCTAVSCVLITVLLAKEAPDRIPNAVYETPSPKSIFLSIGTIMFAYGGAATFPCFQNDMKQKEKFSVALTLGSLMMLFLYLPVAIGGYLVFGSQSSDNILSDVKSGPITTSIDVLMAFHVFCAFLILVNPMNLTLEAYLDIEHSFNWTRCLFRTIMCAVIIFVALTIPKFGQILNLVGGSTIALTTFIMPPIYYLCLCHQSNPEWPERRATLFSKVALITIAVIGIIGGVAATYSSLLDIVQAFSLPCYVSCA